MTIEDHLRAEMSSLVADAPVDPERFERVTRGARRIRRRRTSAVGAALAVVLAVPAVQFVRPAPDIPAVDRLARTVPASVMLRGEQGTLLAMRKFGDPPVPASGEVAGLKDVVQLRTGEIVGLREGQLVVVDRSGVRELGRSDAVIVGPGEHSLWLVERRGTALNIDGAQDGYRFGGDQVQRVRLDGSTEPGFLLPDSMRIAGEAADGLLALQLVRTKLTPTSDSDSKSVLIEQDVDLVVVKVGTGEVVRRVAEDAGVTAAAGDTYVWDHNPCGERHSCDSRVVDTRTGETRTIGRDDSFSGSSMPPQLSADGRWLAYSREVSYGQDQSGLVLIDLLTGRMRILSEPTDSYVWSGVRLLFLDPSRDRVGVHLPRTGETHWAAAHGADRVLGAFDLLDASR